MTAKAIELRGYGKILIQSVNLKEREFETVSPDGKPLTRKVVGERAKTVYVTKDGTEVPNNQVCKKIVTDEGEEFVTQKFNPTKEVQKESVDVIDDNSVIFDAIERKFYSVVCDDKELKDLVLKKRKSLVFPVVVGQGFKLWKGVLTNWNGQLLLVGCRGNLKKELEKYTEETVEIELENEIPKKELLKVLEI